MAEEQMMEAYRAGFNEGQKHIAPSPETLRIVEQMQMEWAQLKTRAFYALLGSLTLAVGYGVWVGKIQNQLTTGEKALATLTAQVISLDTRVQQSDISDTEIKTKLANIEVTLIEIKNAIRDK